MSRGISRRELFKRFGLTAAALPLLPSLGAWAQATQAPRKRFVAITITHGIFPQHLLPYIPNNLTLSSADPGNMLQNPSQYMQKVAFTQKADAAVIDLSPYSGALSPIFSSKWQAIKPEDGVHSQPRREQRRHSGPHVHGAARRLQLGERGDAG